ncbi:helix-turn-helix domain-containing protein [Asaia lannensis]|uniref:Sigma-54 factor interaction domain-containing protein n=1 Tax=Asaia lannensis NBRC 102526 TaxID=1307926 RepID=A0ABT1CCR5_9PROT|nr:helix-turn-helix domain-containing protein [Asaia lannensis]MCO6158658.1 hypothetical protein [Asaia lannensis NBRC 102526]
MPEGHGAAGRLSSGACDGGGSDRSEKAGGSTSRTIGGGVPTSLGFDGQSESVRKLRDRLDEALRTFGVHGLIGEAGSGRTRAARYLWAHCGRRGRFVSVIDRLSLDDALSDGETGCLFINEIGLAEPALQADLHALIRERQAGERPAVICTSSWTPARMMQDRRMDDALSSLLEDRCVAVPPARERQQDLPALASVWSGQGGASFSFQTGCFEWMASQDWPGNFRQIRQLLHYVTQKYAGRKNAATIVTAARLAELHQADMAQDAASFQGLMARYLPSLLDLETDVQGSLHARVLAEVERPLFRLVLKATDGNQIRAAALLGINRNTLRKRLQLLGIEAGRSRS